MLFAEMEPLLIHHRLRIVRVDQPANGAIRVLGHVLGL
jgi:hypothetical protein